MPMALSASRTGIVYRTPAYSGLEEDWNRKPV